MQMERRERDWNCLMSDRLLKPKAGQGCWMDTLDTMAAHRRMPRTGCPSKMTRSMKGGD